MISLNNSPSQVYDELRGSPEAEKRRTQLLQTTVSTDNFRPEDYANAIGSFDATSCIGCIFTPQSEKKHVVSFHHDGRDLKDLLPLFEKYKGEVVVLEITGGVQNRDKSGELSNSYELLEEESTQKNFESLIAFANKIPCTVKLRSWTIGDATDRAKLVSEYVAQPSGKLTLLQSETLHEKCLPPMFIQRFANHSIMSNKGFPVVFDATKSLELSIRSEKNYSKYRRFAQNIENKSDKEILRNYSTTPELEPSYFCDTLRNLAKFILKEDHEITAHSTLPKKQPCIVIQGEAGRIVKK